jgi:hypothetical protein
MTKVVYLNGSKKKSSAKDHKAVVTKRVRDAEGEIVRVSSVDTRSATFGEDLRYVFSKNVAEARRENIAATGRADGIVKKR